MRCQEHEWNLPRTGLAVRAANALNQRSTSLHDIILHRRPGMKGEGAIMLCAELQEKGAHHRSLQCSGIPQTPAALCGCQ